MMFIAMSAHLIYKEAVKKKKAKEMLISDRKCTLYRVSSHRKYLIGVLKHFNINIASKFKVFAERHTVLNRLVYIPCLGRFRFFFRDIF